MNNRLIKLFFIVLLLGVASESIAQRPSRRRGAGTTTQPPAGEQQQNNDNKPPSGYNPYGNIPIVVDSSGESNNVIKKSLRNDNAFDKSGSNERTPLPYEHLRWDDAFYAEKVWRELDLREKMNQTFRYKAEDDNGSQTFINILLKAVSSGDVVAFSDERFTTPMTLDEVNQLTVGSADTVGRTAIDDPTRIIEYVVTRKSFDPDQVTRLLIKEEWVFDREASRMMVRILGIAPLKSAPQQIKGAPERLNLMFWVYYPDLRPTLAKYEVYNSKNMGMARMTWEELFEARMFSSYITKSTLDNPAHKVIRNMIKDPILALLEGENIRERIFNFEQDLWSY
jgi:gliding motility associated protien GldN